MLRTWWTKWLPVIKLNYKQLLFVFLIFSLLIIVSFVSVSLIVATHLRNGTAETLRTVEANIETSLREPEITMINSAYSIRDMVEYGQADNDRILQYLTGLTDWLLTQEDRVSGFNGIYGLIRGEYLDGAGWEPDADYEPVERPWYKAAKAAQGQVATTDIYFDAQTGLPIISYSTEIRQANDQREIGVLAIDVLLSHITDYVCSLQLTEGGYGMLVDTRFNILAHPNKELLDTSLAELSKDYAGIVEHLEGKGEDLFFEVVDQDGVRTLLFFRQLFNGWYVAMLAPADIYYHEMSLMRIGLLVLGAVLLGALIVILMRINADKLESDEKSRSKSTFLARMSHEIRTPMNAIIGMADLLLLKELPTAALNDVRTIKQAGSNLLAIINDILDFSKIESNRLELVQQEYETASLLNDVISIIRLRLREKNLLFVLDIDPNLPSRLVGDEIRLRQILINLLSNAVKYTEAGYVALKVSGREEEGSVHLVFKVADTGIGIKEADLANLFTEFGRVEDRRSHYIQGTGLGLAIAKTLCIVLGGNLTVVSRYGEGSVFTAEVVQKIGCSVPLAQVEKPAEHKVLVYETVQLYASSLEKTLGNLGLPYVMVDFAADFEANLKNDKFSFVLLGLESLAGAGEFLKTVDLKGAEVVVMTEMGRTSTLKEQNSLIRPVCSIALANLFNGIGQDIIGTRIKGCGSGSLSHFTAPAARILVVDDIATNLEVAVGLLSVYGCEIDCALSGKEAISLVLRNTYDLVFMDQMMPGLDGVETTAAIRQLRDGHYAKLPIVALTANALVGMREKFIEEGLDDYLAKPIEMHKLHQIMLRWIPREKRIQRSAELAKPQAFSALQEIAGIDLKKGLELTGNSPEAYNQILATFCRDANDRLPRLQAVPALQDLSDFVIQVHALKSASASIGATALSEMAASLEEAGKEKDLEFIEEHLSLFSGQLTELVGAIRETTTQALSKQGQNDEGNGLTREELLNLRSLLAGGEMDKIDGFLQELLEKCSHPEDREILSSIADSVLISEFQMGIELLDPLLGE